MRSDNLFGKEVVMSGVDLHMDKTIGLSINHLKTQSPLISHTIRPSYWPNLNWGSVSNFVLVYLKARNLP